MVPNGYYRFGAMLLRVLLEDFMATIVRIPRKISVSYNAIIKQHGRVLKTKAFETKTAAPVIDFYNTGVGDLATCLSVCAGVSK